jgi:hypothetical protein
MTDARDNQINDHQPPSPTPTPRPNWNRQDEITEILQHKYTTVLHDELIAEYVEIERDSKGGQLVQPRAGGHQKNDKGISKAARELVMLGKTEGARRKLIERALKVAQIDPEVKTAAIEAGLENNRWALRAIAKEPTQEQQLEKVQKIKERKQQPRRRKTSGEAGAATAAHENHLVAAWREAPQPARDCLIEFLQTEGILPETPPVPTDKPGGDVDDGAPSDVAAYMTDQSLQRHPMSDAEYFLDQLDGWPEPDGSGFTNLPWDGHLPDGGQPKFKKFWAGEPFLTRGDFVGHLEWKNIKKADAVPADADRPYKQNPHRGGQLGGLR